MSNSISDLIKYRLLILVLCLTLFSCEKEISFDLDTPEDMLCLNCILEAGNDSVAIYVTKVQSTQNDCAFTPVTDARIELSKEGQLLSGIVYRGNGRYLLKQIPEQGKKYKISVDVDGYKTLTAETTIPVFPNAKAQYKQDTIYDDYWVNGYRTVPKIVVDLKDAPTKDYYWFKLATIINFGGSPWGEYYISYQTDKMYFDEFNRYYVQDINYPFTSYDYIGALRLDEEVLLNSEIQFSLNGGTKKTLFVINGDIHFDKHYKSSIKQFLTYDYDNLPIFEPVQIYSNIENGFGIFGSIAISEFYIDDKK
jgi:hypothetical protein